MDGIEHNGTDPFTTVTPREREHGIEVSGGTWVPYSVGSDSEKYYRFVPATRQLARRFLLNALGVMNPDDKQHKRVAPPTR
jgi:hypothetical protein